jgi:8-oxo-dGTP pyrophosphatase MutT (NUDIX family)
MWNGKDGWIPAVATVGPATGGLGGNGPHLDCRAAERGATWRGMAKDKFHDTTQFAALPWRISEGGTRQVMLLTSRETSRWVIPKGWPMKKRKPAEAASQEAYEEAGLIVRSSANGRLEAFITGS